MSAVRRYQGVFWHICFRERKLAVVFLFFRAQEYDLRFISLSCPSWTAVTLRSRTQLKNHYWRICSWYEIRASRPRSAEEPAAEITALQTWLQWPYINRESNSRLITSEALHNHAPADIKDALRADCAGRTRRSLYAKRLPLRPISRSRSSRSEIWRSKFGQLGFVLDGICQQN